MKNFKNGYLLIMIIKDVLLRSLSLEKHVVPYEDAGKQY